MTEVVAVVRVAANDAGTIALVYVLRDFVGNENSSGSFTHG